MYTCASCREKNCDIGSFEKLPLNCPSSEKEEQEKIKKIYSEGVNYQLAREAALVESEGYCQKTRLEETIDFAKKCGFKKIGIAFCIGFREEAKILYSILREHGFEVDSVVCKNGSIPKEFLKIEENQKVNPNTYEPMCNPIGQAFFLNKSNTDFNIILGLCVGHDSLFMKHSQAPATTLVVKDRVLGHNPAAALYLSNSYYKEKLYLKREK